MITKIKKIKNVWKYLNYSFSWWTENDFWKVNLIFWENTYWKSTLTAIFKSLKTWNKDYIIWRKTFWVTEDQEVEVLMYWKIEKFSNSDFKNENIEIFDNEFVSKNVFYWDEIRKEEQWNLYEIFLDEEIKKDRIEIDLLKNKKETFEKEKKEYVSENYKLSLKIEEFWKIKENTKVDEEITNKQIEIKQINNITKINELLESNSFSYDFSSLKECFSKTLDTSVEKSIENHLNDNLTNKVKGRNFITAWLDLLKSDNCAFCGQNLDENAKSLIDNYRKIFSISYENFKTEIKLKWDKFINIDFEKEVFKFSSLDINFEGIDYQKFYECKKNIDEKIREKQLDLNKVLDFSSDTDFVEFEKIYDEIKWKINILKTTLKNPKTLVDLEKELSFLNNQKIRYEQKYIDLFSKIDYFDELIKNLKNEINTKNTDLWEKVDQVFKNNLSNVNEFLGKMGATFALKEFIPIKHMWLKTTHYCEYNFVFNNSFEVNISNRQTQKDSEKDNLPHFKNTLSDSERRTLAFAFFLSKLKNDKNLENKIIILDDPFSSFDENRKEKTIQLFRDITNHSWNTPMQKIILTHEKWFFSKCYNEFPRELLKTFKIHSSIVNWSTLKYYSEDEFLTEEYFENLNYIQKSYQTSTNLNEALKKARPCIEHILKRKYYFCLDKSDLSWKSITTYLDKIWAKCWCKQEIINLNLHQEMHDWHPILKLSETEKASKLKDFLELIEKI